MNEDNRPRGVLIAAELVQIIEQQAELDHRSFAGQVNHMLSTVLKVREEAAS